MTNPNTAGQRPGLRYLSVVRLSAFAMSSTSPDRQRDHCLTAIGLRDGVDVGVAEDLDVSATKFSPFKRPQLGPWLTDPEKIDQWDVLVFWRLDRVVRSLRDLVDLIDWCDKHGKLLVSATESIDMTDRVFGRAMIQLIAVVAEIEANTIRLRVEDAQSKLRTMDRWITGIPTLGFKTVPHPSGSGFGLAHDPEGQQLLHEMAGKLIDGWSLTSVAQWCNETGQLSSRDLARKAKDREAQGGPWMAGSVRRIFSNPATQGWKTEHDPKKQYRPRKLILDAEGQPIRMAPPSFDDATWEQIQAAVAARTASGKRRTHSPNPMLGVGVCGVCGATLAQQNSSSRPDKAGNRKVYRTYRCGRTPKSCVGLSFNADELDARMESTFLSWHGFKNVRERVFVPGTDNRAGIEQTRASLARIRAESDQGLVTDDDEYLARLTALTVQLRAMEADPYRPSRWEYRETGETYGEAWAKADPARRRELMVSAEALVILHHRDAPKRLDFEMNLLSFWDGPTPTLGEYPENATSARCWSWTNHGRHMVTEHGNNGELYLHPCPGGPREFYADGRYISEGLWKRLYGDLERELIPERLWVQGRAPEGDFRLRDKKFVRGDVVSDHPIGWGQK
jgi:DNA invertase Pin-like site-specific DNA recombinase